ncbi:unnamed protein product [Nesidiocoris tenuis]|uniref:Uncharacterized protein n=1 Tax=Nesidiocoris tenuis TaxID=355587 RepID=A0A6H5HEH5_9HEMI|nr:unnamed protein product [Nesidiocoris tenuis]
MSLSFCFCFIVSLTSSSIKSLSFSSINERSDRWPFNSKNVTPPGKVNPVDSRQAESSSSRSVVRKGSPGRAGTRGNYSWPRSYVTLRAAAALPQPLEDLSLKWGKRSVCTDKPVTIKHNSGRNSFSPRDRREETWIYKSKHKSNLGQKKSGNSARRAGTPAGNPRKAGSLSSIANSRTTAAQRPYTQFTGGLMIYSFQPNLDKPEPRAGAPWGRRQNAKTQGSNTYMPYQQDSEVELFLKYDGKYSSHFSHPKLSILPSENRFIRLARKLVLQAKHIPNQRFHLVGHE